MNPEQALESMKQLEPKDVVILAYDAQGNLMLRSSKMNNASTLWMLECAKLAILKEVIGQC
jgi:hypothetical protein